MGEVPLYPNEHAVVISRIYPKLILIRKTREMSAKLAQTPEGPCVVGAACGSCPRRDLKCYRGTSLIKKLAPHGPYIRNMPRALKRPYHSFTKLLGPLTTDRKTRCFKIELRPISYRVPFALCLECFDLRGINFASEFLIHRVICPR